MTMMFELDNCAVIRNVKCCLLLISLDVSFLIKWANGEEISTISFQREEYLCLPQDPIIPYHFYFIKYGVSH